MLLTDLPDDIIRIIAEHLPFQEILDFRLACKLAWVALGDVFSPIVSRRYGKCGVVGACNSLVGHLLQHCSNLRFVDLIGTENSGLNGEGLLPLIVNNPTLHRLRVVFSPSSTPYYRPPTDVFRALGKHCLKLTYLALLPWESLNGVGPSPTFPDPMEEKSIALLLRGCTSLQYLYIPCADGHVLHQVAHHAPKLLGFGVIHPDLFEGLSPAKHWDALLSVHTCCNSLASLTFANLGYFPATFYEKLSGLKSGSLRHITVVDGPAEYDENLERVIVSYPLPFSVRTVRVLHGVLDVASPAVPKSYSFRYVYASVDTSESNTPIARARQKQYEYRQVRDGPVYQYFRTGLSTHPFEIFDPETVAFTVSSPADTDMGDVRPFSDSFYKQIRLLTFQQLQHVYHERKLFPGELEFLCQAAPNMRTCLFVARVSMMPGMRFEALDENALTRALQCWPNLTAIALSSITKWSAVISNLRLNNGRRLRWFVASIPSQITFETALTDLASVCPRLSFVWVYHEGKSCPDPSETFLSTLRRSLVCLVAVCGRSPISPRFAGPSIPSQMVGGVRVLSARDADVFIRSRLQFLPTILVAHAEELFDHDAYHPKLI